jgi:hypothetical protein
MSKPSGPTPAAQPVPVPKRAKTAAPTTGGQQAEPAPPALFNLVYCSRAAAGTNADMVKRIVEAAQRVNLENGITGLLVLGDGVFFQWLEGPRAPLLALLDRLIADPRHHDLTLLSQDEEVRERLFPDWSMELVSSEHVRDVLQDAMDSTGDPRNHATLARLLAGLPPRPLGKPPTR